MRTLAELLYDPKQEFKQGTEDSREGRKDCEESNEKKELASTIEMKTADEECQEFGH